MSIGSRSCFNRPASDGIGRPGVFAADFSNVLRTVTTHLLVVQAAHGGGDRIGVEASHPRSISAQVVSMNLVDSFGLPSK